MRGATGQSVRHLVLVGPRLAYNDIHAETKIMWKLDFVEKTRDLDHGNDGLDVPEPVVGGT